MTALKLTAITCGIVTIVLLVVYEHQAKSGGPCTPGWKLVALAIRAVAILALALTAVCVAMGAER